MKLAVRIQHVPERGRWVQVLNDLVSENETYPGQVRVITDETHELWTGAKKTLRSYNRDVSHLMVIQDDVLPCRDLIPAAERMIELLPNNPITMFSIGSWAKDTSVKWATLKIWRMAQCYIVPIWIVEDFLQWADRHIDPKIYFDDDRWAMYLFAHEILTYATNPSLVEHLGWNQSTLTGYQSGFTYHPESRMARNFIGFENSALNIDWTEGIKTPLLVENGSWSDFDQYYIK